MRIGIIGPAERAAAWEDHLRSHQSISEVVITPNLQSMDNVDACFLLIEGVDRLQYLMQAARKGYHCFLIAPLPTNTAEIERIYHAAEESNIRLQFSHWPSLAPASKWMRKQIISPRFIQISREISHTHYLESSRNFNHYWINELAFCLRWINSAVHHIDLKTVTFSEKIYALHLFLRFDSSATANIYVNAASNMHHHHRVSADKNYIMDCNVIEQTVRLGEQKEYDHLYFKRRSFDPSEAAQLAASEFIKCIQLKRPSIYNGYHLLELAKTIDKIKSRLARV